MQYLESNENIIRLMIMTAQIPTNWYMVHKACNITYEPWCESWQCEQIQDPETITHLLFKCPNEHYQQERKQMINQVQDVYDKYYKNTTKKEDKIILHDIESDDDYARYFLYPPLKMTLQHRLDMHKAVITYIKRTRNDLIQERYAKGGCMKFDVRGYKIK